MTREVLDERSSEVLKVLIQLHIATGEPVGSESLAKMLAKPLSPATVRNIMADLERQGLLGHPHTSAGRVPTDDGYRVYVDGLMSRRPLPPRDAAAIESSLRAESSSGQVLAAASQVLSRLSHNVGFVLAPDIARVSFMHLDLVRLPYPRILVVMVSRTGLVTNKVVEVEDDFSQDQLQACANYLNANFSGMALGAIRRRLIDMMREEKALYDALLKSVISVGERAFAPEQGEGGSVYLDGTANILDKPEFVDLERMRSLFKTFEEKSRLVRILNACISGEGIRIVIGHENPDPELYDVTLVTAGYPLDEGPGWGLGVLGSTRMEYSHVIALVDHVGRAVRKALSEMAS